MLINGTNETNNTKTTYWIKENHLFGPPTYKCHLCKSVFRKPENICPACRARVVDKKDDPVWVDEISIMDSMFDE